MTISDHSETVSSLPQYEAITEHCVGTTCRPKKTAKGWWMSHNSCNQASSRLESIEETNTMTSFSSKSSLPAHGGANEKIVSTVKLAPVDCSFGQVKEKPGSMLLPEMVVKERKRLTSFKGSGVLLVFAIRRPGCASCRLNGKIISDVAQETGAGCVGIVKETGVADSSLIEMYSTYFRQPIYKDEKWRVYEAMGNRKISVWSLLGKVPQLNAIYKKQKVENVPFGGDIFTQGGVLVFDKDGALRFTYYERFGEFFDPMLLKHVIEQARKPLSDTSISDSDHSIVTTERKANKQIRIQL